MTEEQRSKIVNLRKEEHHPWHSPPHFEGNGLYHLTAANYRHKKIIGKSYQRILDFSNNLLNVLSELGTLKAWSVLANHYHLLIELVDLKETTKKLGKLHGRTSFYWNQEENTKGRQCWSKVADRKIRNTNHYYATLNYIHHNPVKHKYVKKWDEWPFSSAKQFLEDVGRDNALKIWTQYPVLDYGKGWDDN